MSPVELGLATFFIIMFGGIIWKCVVFGARLGRRIRKAVEPKEG
jgi:hypothetical protein